MAMSKIVSISNIIIYANDNINININVNVDDNNVT